MMKFLKIIYYGDDEIPLEMMQRCGPFLLPQRRTRRPECGKRFEILLFTSKIFIV